MMTSNTAEQKNVIGKKELRSIFLRSLSLEYSWNYERQQNMGYCFAMLPAIKKIYQKKEDQIAAAKRHMEFFNTTPYISTAVFGISTAMEESNARNEDFDTSSINNVKVALMGPLAGIGDSMFWGTLRVIAKARAYAEKYKDDPYQIWIGSGNLWGPTYSFAMCVLEESQWLRTKSVTSPEFFHGTIELVERSLCSLKYDRRTD